MKTKALVKLIKLMDKDRNSKVTISTYAGECEIRVVYIQDNQLIIETKDFTTQLPN